MTEYEIRVSPERKFLPAEVQNYANEMSGNLINSSELKSICVDAPKGVELKFDPTNQPLVMYNEWIILHLHEQ